MPIAILGHGRAGKTTSAEYLHHRTNGRLRFACSTSEFAKNLLGSRLPDLQEKPDHLREIWARAIADYNAEDGSGIKLYKTMAGSHDIFDGVRRQEELDKLVEWFASQGRRLWKIWIHRAVPIDPTCLIDRDSCDFVVNNTGTIDDLNRKLRSLCGAPEWDEKNTEYLYRETNELS